MPKNIQSVLGQDNIAGTFEAVVPSLPQDLPAEYYAMHKQVFGRSVVYHKTTGTRKNAPLNIYNGKSAGVDGLGIDGVPVNCMFSNFHWNVQPEDLLNLADAGSNVRTDFSISEIMRQLAFHKQKQQNLRVSAIHMALLTGAIYADADGYLLSSSSGAVLVNEDFGVPAGNQDQLLDEAGATIIDASWATSTTAISTHLRKIKATARQRTGVELTYAVYGANVLDYILRNTRVQALMQSNPMLTQTGQTGELPEDLMGFKWIPGDVMFWEDEDGTKTSLVGEDEVKFLPSMSVGSTWFENIEGSYPVADSVDMSDEAGAIQGLAFPSGMTAQSKLEDDPVGAKIIHRDCFLPTLLNPAAVYYADVTP